MDPEDDEEPVEEPPRLHYPNELARRAAKGAGYRPHPAAEPSPPPA